MLALFKMCSSMIAIYTHNNRLWCLAKASSDRHPQSVFIPSLTRHNQTSDAFVSFFHDGTTINESIKCITFSLHSNEALAAKMMSLF